MSFAAKYSGRCHAEDYDYGDYRINVGDECRFMNNEVMHYSCSTRANLGELCSSCFTYHPPGACLDD